MQNESNVAPHSETIRRLIESEIAVCLKGSEPLTRAIRGEAVDLGHPLLNVVAERTARRLAALPDAAVPRLAEVCGPADCEIIIREMISDALAEIDVLCGFRTSEEALA